MACKEPYFDGHPAYGNLLDQILWRIVIQLVVRVTRANGFVGAMNARHPSEQPQGTSGLT